MCVISGSSHSQRTVQSYSHSLRQSHMQLERNGSALSLRALLEMRPQEVVIIYICKIMNN